MSAFKDAAAADIAAVFTNPDEFGEPHDINGHAVIIVPDNDALQRREDKGGAQLGDYMFYVEAKELGFRPLPDREIIFDGKHMVITECKEDVGVYTITLRQNRL